MSYMVWTNLLADMVYWGGVQCSWKPRLAIGKLAHRPSRLDVTNDEQNSRLAIAGAAFLGFEAISSLAAHLMDHLKIPLFGTVGN